MTRTDAAVASTGRARRPAGPTGLDGTTVFTVYLFALLLIPSNQTITVMGSLGVPGMLIGIAAFAWWAWEQVNRWEAMPGGVSPVRRAAIVFLVVLLIVYAHSALLPLPDDERSVADSGLLRAIGMCGVILALNDGLTSTERWRVLLRRLTIAGALIGVLAIAQALSRQLIVDAFSLPGLAPNETSPVDFQVRSGRVRPVATATNPIELGSVLAMLLPLTVTLAFRAERTSTRVWSWIGVGLMGLASLLSISRTALICAAVGMIPLLFNFPARLRRLLIAVGVVGLLAVSFAMPGLAGTLRGMFTGAADDPSVASRVNSYAIASAFFSENPILGRGFGTFLPKYWILDNLYLQFTLETGLLGLAALLLLIGAALLCAWKARRLFVRSVDRDCAAALLGGAAAGAVSLLFFDAFSFPQSAGIFCVMVGLCGAACRLARADVAHDAMVLPDVDR